MSTTLINKCCYTTLTGCCCCCYTILPGGCCYTTLPGCCCCYTTLSSNCCPQHWPYWWLLFYYINRWLLLFELTEYCFVTALIHGIVLHHVFYSNNKGLWLYNIDRWFFYTCIWNCSSIKHARILTNVHVGLLVKLVKSWYLPKSYFSMSYNVT